MPKSPLLPRLSHLCFQVMPYYLKSENNTELDRVGTKYHRKGGVMNVER